MRIVIVGAGAIGGVIAARLVEAGRDVVVVARGRHRATTAARGLVLVEPDGERTVRVPVVGSVRAVTPGADDVVALCVKTQDTPAVLADLVDHVPPTTRVACFQNGVANERLVASAYRAVQGVVVMMPAAHLEPGRVEAYASPIPGLFDIGLAAGGTDVTTEGLVAELAAGGFDARAVDDVMRWKHTKLLMNLGNAVDAICVRDADAAELVRRARAEGREIFAAAGVDHASREEEAQRRADLLQVRPIDGAERAGGSSWQSIARGLGSIEVDALNGEIVRIGERVGRAAPVNALLRDRAEVAAAARIPPNSIPAAELLARLSSA